MDTELIFDMRKVHREGQLGCVLAALAALAALLSEAKRSDRRTDGTAMECAALQRTVKRRVKYLSNSVSSAVSYYLIALRKGE